MGRFRRLSIRFAAPLATLVATGCTTVPSEPLEPPVEVVVQKEQVPVPCPALAALGPEPVYPDTDAAIRAAPNIAERSKLYAVGRKMRIARLAEYAATKLGCLF